MNEKETINAFAQVGQGKRLTEKVDGVSARDIERGLSITDEIVDDLICQIVQSDSTIRTTHGTGEREIIDYFSSMLSHVADCVPDADTK